MISLDGSNNCLKNSLVLMNKDYVNLEDSIKNFTKKNEKALIEELPK